MEGKRGTKDRKERIVVRDRRRIEEEKGGREGKRGREERKGIARGKR